MNSPAVTIGGGGDSEEKHCLIGGCGEESEARVDYHKNACAFWFSKQQNQPGNRKRQPHNHKNTANTGVRNSFIRVSKPNGVRSTHKKNKF
jgi:hypothetical protein